MVPQQIIWLSVAGVLVGVGIGYVGINLAQQMRTSLSGYPMPSYSYTPAVTPVSTPEYAPSSTPSVVPTYVPSGSPFEPTPDHSDFVSDTWPDGHVEDVSVTWTERHEGWSSINFHDELLSTIWPPNHNRNTSFEKYGPKISFGPALPEDHSDSVSNIWPRDHSNFISSSWPEDHSEEKSGIWLADHVYSESSRWPDGHGRFYSDYWDDVHVGQESATVHAEWRSNMYPPNHFISVSKAWPDTHLPSVSKSWPENHKVDNSYGPGSPEPTWPKPPHDAYQSTLEAWYSPSPEWPDGHLEDKSILWDAGHMDYESSTWPEGHALVYSSSWPTDHTTENSFISHEEWRSNMYPTSHDGEVSKTWPEDHLPSSSRAWPPDHKTDNSYGPGSPRPTWPKPSAMSVSPTLSFSPTGQPSPIWSATYTPMPTSLSWIQEYGLARTSGFDVLPSWLEGVGFWMISVPWKIWQWLL